MLKMLRLPICGFARPVDDVVARAMAFLNSREDYTARSHPRRSTSAPPKPKGDD
jgi:hypothetical protein